MENCTQEAVIKEGQMRVWYSRNLSTDPDSVRYYDVDSIDTAKALILQMTDEDRLDPKIKENNFGLEVFMNNDWVEWTDEDSLDIMEQF